MSHSQGRDKQGVCHQLYWCHTWNLQLVAAGTSGSHKGTRVPDVDYSTWKEDRTPNHP